MCHSKSMRNLTVTVIPRMKPTPALMLKSTLLTTISPTVIGPMATVPSEMLDRLARWISASGTFTCIVCPSQSAYEVVWKLLRWHGHRAAGGGGGVRCGDISEENHDHNRYQYERGTVSRDGIWLAAGGYREPGPQLDQ